MRTQNFIDSIQGKIKGTLSIKPEEDWNSEKEHKIQYVFNKYYNKKYTNVLEFKRVLYKTVTLKIINK